MGILKKVVKIMGKKGIKEVEAIIDTGSTYTKIPQALAEEIGAILTGEEKALIANGDIVDVKIGIAVINIDGCSKYSFVTITDSGPVLIGAETLQSYGAEVNMKTHKLIIKECPLRL